ncbi:MAG TPA: amidohydrolase family protein, partial [Puia sp.]|nr:amidohydrolase family protein [Puia sp.]
EMLEKNAVLITDENGIIQEIISTEEAGDDIEIFKGIISPGFINTHCHLELSHMKGLIPEKTGLVDFLLSVIKQRNFSADIIQQSIVNAENEMIEKGIVAVGDICNTTDTLAQKNQGNLYYHNFIETIGFPETVAEQRFDSAKEIFKQFAQQYALPIESNSIVPHAPYSVSKKLFELIANFPGNHVLSIHNQESEEENKFFENGDGDLSRLYHSLGIDISFFKPTGKRSLESYLHHFHKNQSLILVHNVAMNEEDLKVVGSWQLAVGNTNSEPLTENWKLKTENLYFCLCPNANQYITGLLPDIDLLIKHNCKIVVGTDSLASNHQLDILEELKTIQKKFPLETKTLLQWATINGAYALQLDDVVGSFEKGNQPGVVLIESIENKKLTDHSKAKRII